MAQIFVVTVPTWAYHFNSESLGYLASGQTSGSRTLLTLSHSYKDLPSRYTSPRWAVNSPSNNQSPLNSTSKGLRTENLELGTSVLQTLSPSWSQFVIGSAPVMTTSPSPADRYIILWSFVPPLAGLTHSLYTPACTITVSPGIARAAARDIVRKG